jgi:phosphatidylserine/phosphatidylglycerophosphate/cardiolipin synthase-like enzyme
LEFLIQLFLTDFEKKEAIFTIPKEIVLSPINSRKQLENIIQHAKKKVIIYTQSLSDTKIFNLLKEVSKNEVKISICIANNEDINTDILSLPEKYKNITLSRPKKPYIHTKTILIDTEFIYMGSINLSRNSIENNREV